MTRAPYQSIDPAVLMDAAGDQASFVALSRTFLQSTPALFALLQQALAQNDFPAIAARSHALKGMAMLLGADRLSSVLQRHESAARQGRMVADGHVELASLLALVQREVAQSIADTLLQQ